jgi:tetratricopeptide (TPR) repeat protein
METNYTTPTFEKSSDQLLAEELFDDALEIEDPKKQLKIANKALSVDPLCSDALTLLGNLTPNNTSKVGYYQKALAAFEERYGKTYIEKNKGVFWFKRETRPYIRALHAYALVCWEMDNPKKGIELLTRILELNPNDNLNVRYILIVWLFTQKNLHSVEKLLNKYPEPSVEMLYSSLLLTILENPRKTHLLEKEYKKAFDLNPYVISYLLGKARLPEQVPKPLQRGSQEEAAAYCILASPAWVVFKEVLEVLEILSMNYPISLPV